MFLKLFLAFIIISLSTVSSNYIFFDVNNHKGFYLHVWGRVNWTSEYNIRNPRAVLTCKESSYQPIERQLINNKTFHYHPYSGYGKMPVKNTLKDCSNTEADRVQNDRGKDIPCPLKPVEII